MERPRVPIAPEKGGDLPLTTGQVDLVQRVHEAESELQPGFSHGKQFALGCCSITTLGGHSVLAQVCACCREPLQWQRSCRCKGAGAPIQMNGQNWTPWKPSLPKANYLNMDKLQSLWTPSACTNGVHKFVAVRCRTEQRPMALAAAKVFTGGR